MSDPWRTLVLLGSSRWQGVPPPPHATLAASWQALDWTDKEGALLAAASLHAAARAAGAMSQSAATTSGPCDAEMLRVCPPPASRVLRALLAGEQPRCLREWLQLAAEARCVVPPRHLPALLDRGTREAALRTAVAPVLGARGSWLGAQHPEWQWASGGGDIEDAAWQTGAPAQRAQWLRQVQARDPARAAAALMATWGEENGDARESLLGVVAPRPDPSLLPWLEEQPLRDRRAAIRQLARKALARLPAAPFHLRANARATPLLAVHGMLKKRLMLTLPATFEPDWRADGLEEKPPEGIGPRSFWAAQLLANVPLSHWLATFRVDAAKWFAWQVEDESRDALTRAWIDGQLLLPTPEAAVPFVRAFLLGGDWPRHAPDKIEFMMRWLAELPPATVADVVDELLGRSSAEDLFLPLLLRFDLAAFCRDAERAALAIEALLARPHLSAAEAEALAVAVPRSAVASTLSRLVVCPTLTSTAEAFVRTLEFRLTCCQAFAGSSSP